MIFAPFVLGIAVVGVLFNYLLDTQFGLINYFLGLVGIPAIAWTQTQPAAWVGLVGMTVWWTLGFNTIIYMAGLQDIPAEQYEAAEIDGAGRWGAFRAITLPGLAQRARLHRHDHGPGQRQHVRPVLSRHERRTGRHHPNRHHGDDPGGLAAFKMGTASAMSYMLAIFLGIVSVIIFFLMRERKPKP